MKNIYLLAGSLSILGLTTLPAGAVSTNEQLPVETQAIEATPVATEQDELLLADQSLSESTSVDDLMADSKEDSVGQVTSVSQLSDVQPDDWAFQAIQSLVERYGCVAGYPNGTFRPDRAMSRREAAALVNACLDNLSNRFATKEDLDALKALQDEFAAELATLRGRVDGLEARVATVESQQFSTTTKLQGEVVMAAQFGDFVSNSSDTVADAFNGNINGTVDNDPAVDSDGDGIPNNDVDQAAGPDSRVSAISRVRLNFNTSFSGDDLLATQLEVGNNGGDFFSRALGGANPGPIDNAANPLAGSRLVDTGAADYAGIGNTVKLRRLAYTFKPGENLAVTVGTNIFPSDFVDFNSYANNSAQDFSSGFFINNPLIITDAVDIEGGAGAAFDWNPNAGNISVRGVYVAANGNLATSDANGGLGGDPHQGTLELEYANTFGEDDQNNFAIRLQGTYAETFNVEQKVLGLNAEATFGSIGVFGRYGISFDPQNQNPGGGDLFNSPVAAGAQLVGSNTIQTWMAGVGYKDALVPGSLFAVAAGMPFLVNNTNNSNDQINLEAFYRFPVNDNITITPAVMYIINPLGTRNGFGAGGNDNDIIQGLVRATFSF